MYSFKCDVGILQRNIDLIRVFKLRVECSYMMISYRSKKKVCMSDSMKTH